MKWNLKRWGVALLATSLFLFPSLEPEEKSEREAFNLVAFAKAFGYLRFFYPGDAASSLDWEKFAIYGSDAVREKRSLHELQTALTDLFLPIAPETKFTFRTSEPSPELFEAEIPVTFWQYFGVELVELPNPYRQRRVVMGIEMEGREPLFEPIPPPSMLHKTIVPELTLSFPAVLPLSTKGKTSSPDPSLLAQLKSELEDIERGKDSLSDWRARVAGIILTWTVVQHFHPYLDLYTSSWEGALEKAIRRTLKDTMGGDFRNTLLEMIAVTGDGHGALQMENRSLGGVPIKFDFIEDQIVVTGVMKTPGIQRGDILLQIDGVEATKELKQLMQVTPGSLQLSRFRALNRMGEGPGKSEVRLLLRRGKTEWVETITRHPDHAAYFFKRIQDRDLPAFQEIREGIYYINLHEITLSEFREQIPTLSQAKGVIFDSRFDGIWQKIPKEERFLPDYHLLPYLIAEPAAYSPMMVPQVTWPDRQNWRRTYFQRNPVQPAHPRFQGEIVFINDPGVMSYGETWMAIVEHANIGTLVGEPTGGCNGNGNLIPIPGGIEVRWTGMEVQKVGGDRLDGIGFAPDIPVMRTLKAIREGRDETLEAALDYLEGK